MDTIEAFFRILAYLVNILANAPKACEALSKGWAAFTEFLQSLDGYGEEQLPPPPQNATIIPLTGTLRLNVFDGPIGMTDGYPALRLRQNTAAFDYSETPLPLRFS